MCSGSARRRTSGENGSHRGSVRANANVSQVITSALRGAEAHGHECRGGAGNHGETAPDWADERAGRGQRVRSDVLGVVGGGDGRIGASAARTAVRVSAAVSRWPLHGHLAGSGWRAAQGGAGLALALASAGASGPVSCRASVAVLVSLVRRACHASPVRVTPGCQSPGSGVRTLDG
jgi:hypothetical protein